MSAPAAVRAAPAAGTGWLVLSFDAVRLALPQRSVRQVELTADLSPPSADAPATTAALPQPDGTSWPAYCLDGALRRLRTAPPQRRLCVFVDGGGAVFGLLCDRVSSLATDAELAVEPLPGCMTGLPSPVTAVARLGAAITTVTSAAALRDYLRHLQDGDHD
jgi:hypothetical protein